jgi:hypothetical protein
MTIENQYDVWSFSIYQEYERVYDESIISHQDFATYETRLYEFLVKNNTRIFCPFNAEGKYKLMQAYGEYRALRNINNNETYLYKSFLPQPQNCSYEEIEIEKMGIKKSFDYKEIFPLHPKSDRNKAPVKNEETGEWNPEYYYSLIGGPQENQWYTENDVNSLNSSQLTVMHYPKELAEIWESVAKEVRDIIKGKYEKPPVDLIEELRKENIEFENFFIVLKYNVFHLRDLYDLQTNKEARLPITHEKYDEEARHIFAFKEMSYFLRYFTNLQSNELYNDDDIVFISPYT